MKKKFVFCGILACAVVTLTGCGHNVLSVSDGTFLNVGYDPNNSKLGIQYVNGNQITVVEKDNARLTVEKQDNLDLNGKVTSKITKFTYEIKEQVTGSDVDMAAMKK